MEKHTVKIGKVKFTSGETFSLIAGPCQLETLDEAALIANAAKKICEELGIGYVFKASFDKANRSSLHSERGPGLKEGLNILKTIKKICGVPVISDLHCVSQVEPAAEVLDAIQIPAFLCRQTDLIVEAAKTGLPVNIKKGQFLSPWEIKNAIEKVTGSGNDNVLVTERGTSFGYNNLVVDMRSFVLMSDYGYPVIFDGTHSTQLPGGLGTSSGGQREMIPYLCQAAVATGKLAGLFLEIHPEPERSPSDSQTILPLDYLKPLLLKLKSIWNAVR